MNLKIIAFLPMLLAILTCSPIKTPEEVVELPDFDELWNYDGPVGTEFKFRELLGSTNP